MKRASYVLLCILCGVAGTVIGRYAWPDGEVLGGKPSSAARSSNLAATREEKTPERIRGGPRFAALALAMAVRGETGGLPALIEASAHDADALEQLAAIWSKTDPAVFALALANSRAIKGSASEQCAAVLTSMMSRWARRQPDDAWNTAEKFPLPLRRFMLSQVALDCIIKDPKEGLEFVLRHPGIVPGVSSESLNGRRDLVPLIQQLPDSATKFHSLRNALKGVPLNEALAAVPHTPEESNTHVRRSLIRDAAKTSTEEVIAFHQQATGVDRYAAAQAVGDALLIKDPAAAVEWARANLSGEMRSAVIRKAAEDLQSKDPAAAEAARALFPESFKPAAVK
jgi:hypothetical protein